MSFSPPPAVRHWQILLILAVLLPLGALSFLNRATSLHGEDGVRWVGDAGALRAAALQAGGPGETAGVAAGDRLISVEGLPVREVRQLRDLLWGRGDMPTTYLLRRGEELLTRRIVPSLNGEENRFFYYLCLAGILGLGAGCLAAWRLPGEPACPLLLALSVALYLTLVLSPGGGGGILDWVLYWGDLAGRLFAAPLLVHFVLRVAGEKGDRGGVRSRTALYLPPVSLLALNLYLIPFKGALAFRDPQAAVAIKDRLEILAISCYAAAAALLLLLRLHTVTRSRIRWRLKWLATSAASGLLPFALLYGIPVALKIPPGTLGEFSVFPLCLVMIGFAAALFQDRAVSLDATLRGVVRWVLGGAILMGGGLLLSWSLGHLPGGLPRAGILPEVILPLVASALLMVLFRRSIARLADRLIGRTPPAMAHALLDFRSVLNGEIRLEELGSGLLEKLKEYFHLETALLLVRDGEGGLFRRIPPPEGSGRSEPPEIFHDASLAARLGGREMILMEAEREDAAGELDPFRRAGYRYLFPLVVGRQVNALLMVGLHRDGSPLGGEEVDVLEALASQAARSVEGARLYREIEQRIEKEARLRTRSQGILEASRIGILLSDDRGVVTQVNRSAGEILGRHDSVGKPLDSVLPRGLLMLLDRSGRGERPSGEQGRVYRYSFGGADGRTRMVNVTRAPLAAGSEEGQVYTFDDVSEETRREAMMLRQEHLASVGFLASQVAHEVNTPLTGIASYAQMLMARMSSRMPEMDLLRKIEAQAFRAAGIAGSVLNLSRRREGEPLQRMDPGPVVAECLTLFETHLKGKNIRLTMERAASLPCIRGSRGRLQQAVLNLLMNAAGALPEGGEIRLEMDVDGEFLRIRVADDGVGISPEILPRIFEPFFTARSGGQGTGLGLSVVRQIMDEHRGRVLVESRPGAGSTFDLLIPAEASRLPEASHGA
jgi:two-component system, NtrC family, sensor kinase